MVAVLFLELAFDDCTVIDALLICKLDEHKHVMCTFLSADAESELLQAAITTRVI